MEFLNNNNHINKKRVVKFKSVTHNYKKKLPLERSNSNSNISSISKKTGAFEENVVMATTKLNSFSTKISPNNLCFSIQNNVAIHSSYDLSIKDLKDKTDVNNIYTNINISIDNPNFSINNIENNNKTSSAYEANKITKNLNNKDSSVGINNNTFISFKGSNIESETHKEINKKVSSSIYADYLANKSNTSEILYNDMGNESKLKILNDYLDKNKILQYEYNKGYIAGFSAYTYQNQEMINKNKLSININIDKEENDEEKRKNKPKIHLINFFSLFCGDIKDEDDDLSKFLKNNFKNILLEDKEIISDTAKAIKKSFFKCEMKYINYYLKEKKKQNNSKIQNCSIIIILNIDDIFYIGNIGNIVSILSCNLSKKIEYISKENITQEEYENNIKKKRKSLYATFNYSITFANELNSSKECFNNSKLNINQKDNKNILNIINLNTIYSYKFIRYFPGKNLQDIVFKNNNNDNKTNNYNRRSTNFIPIINNNNIKINNYMSNDKKLEQKKTNDDLTKNRRASLGPFFKISPKSKNYNPTKNYRKSCAQDDSNNKTQIIKIISSYPDIVSFRYKKKHDFIFIGCEIIFQKLSNDEICKSVYETMEKCIKKHRSFELFLGWVIKDIIKMCISYGINSNISCLFICFNSIKKLYLKENLDEIKNILVPLCLTYSKKKNYEFYDDLLSFSFIDVDKANNYNELIEKNIDKKNISNYKIVDILDENDNNNDNDKKNTQINDSNNCENINNKSKIKNVKKKCCCFC